MNEEKIAKSVKTLYIITYAIMIAFGVVWLIIGVPFFQSDIEEVIMFGIFIIIIGAIFVVGGICWLIYFIKMPEYSITYKDGKLNFRNKLECTPAQLDYIEAKGGGLDGAIFSFGRIVVYVGGKKYNFRFIQDAQYVANRLLQLKNGVAMQTSAFGNAYSAAPQPAVTESAEPVAEQTVAEQPESAEPVAEENVTTEKEEGNG